MALAWLQTHLKPGARVLVVGAGGGKEVTTFANQPWHLTGVDPSAQMLKIAEERWQELTPRAELELIQGEVADLPENGRFDAATCSLVMHFLPDDGSKTQILHDIANRLNANAPYIHVDIFDPMSGWPQDPTEDGA